MNLNRNLLILGVVLLVLVVSVGGARADCVNLTGLNEYVINESTTLCTGTYLMNNTDSDDYAILINASDVILDCNDSVIKGNSTGYAINMSTRNNITIKNCNIMNYTSGITNGFVYSSGLFIENVNISWVEFGVNADNISNVVINNSGFSNIVADTSVYPTYIGLWWAIENLTITNCEFKDGIVSAADSWPIKFGNISKGTIQNNIIYNMTAGIAYYDGAVDLKIDNNTLYDLQTDAIVSWGGSGKKQNINFSNNLIYDVNGSYDDGSYLGAIVIGWDRGYENIVSVFNNTVYNSGVGINITESSNNLIYNNKFYDNDLNAYDDNGSNFWNISKTLGTNIIGGPYIAGNYWDDYTGLDSTGDGIGNTEIPYNSSGNIVSGGDSAPLANFSFIFHNNTVIPEWPAVDSNVTLFTNVSSNIGNTIVAVNYTLLDTDSDYRIQNINGTQSADGTWNITYVVNQEGTWSASVLAIDNESNIMWDNYTFDVRGYSDEGDHFLCYTCSGCEDALNDNKYSEVKVGGNLSSYYTCIGSSFTETDSLENFSNKVFDCQGYTLARTGPSGWGMLIGYQKVNENNTIQNCRITGYSQGISLEANSINITLKNNTLFLNENSGIRLRSGSNNNSLINNTVNSNSYGISLSSSSNNEISNNTASSNSGSGISLYSSSNNTVTNNTANSNSQYGISLSSSSNNTLTNNTASSNSNHGISLRTSSNNTLTNNTANSNDYGIYLSSSSNENTIANNTANSNSGSGIRLKSNSDDNTITNNTANSNAVYGIHLSFSSSNLIYNNYFNNTNNAYDDSTNSWNTTKTLSTNIIGGNYLGGNYWHDYAGVDTTGDGIGNTETPYTSSGNITGGDYHPLTNRSAIIQKIKVHEPNETNYASSLPRLSFANGSTAVIKLEGTFSETPTITIEQNGQTRVSSENMTNESGVFAYNYTLNGTDSKWYNVSIFDSIKFNYLFYQGELWTDNITDKQGQGYPFRVQLNLTEPGVIERHGDKVDAGINFANSAMESSIRVVSYNGTHYLEVPSQIYNRTYDGSQISEANLVFYTSINKSEQREYYVYYSISNLTTKDYASNLNIDIDIGSTSLIDDNINTFAENDESYSGSDFSPESSLWDYKSAKNELEASDNLRYNTSRFKDLMDPQIFIMHFFNFSAEGATEGDFIWEGYANATTGDPTCEMYIWNEDRGQWDYLLEFSEMSCSSEDTHSITLTQSQIQDGMLNDRLFFGVITWTTNPDPGSYTIYLGSNFVKLNTDATEVPDRYFLENDKLSFHTTNQSGGAMDTFRSKYGTNSDLGASPGEDMLSSPQFERYAPSAKICSIKDQTSPYISIDGGPVFIDYTTEGAMGSNCLINYSVNYQVFKDYVLIKTNSTSLEPDSWDYYFDQKVFLKDGAFQNLSYMFASNNLTASQLIGSGEGTDTGDIGELNWIFFSNKQTGDGFADIFLEQKQSKTLNIETKAYDMSDYEAYTRSTANSFSVTSGDYFYTKVARMADRGLYGSENVNTTFVYLDNPILSVSGSEEKLDNTDPVVDVPADLDPSPASDTENITCSANFSDNLELHYVAVMINSSGVNKITNILVNEQEARINFTMYGGDVGAGNLSCNMTAYDLAGNTKSTENSTTVLDTTPPVFNSISHDPDTAADLDPGVNITITANITEYSGYSNVTLEYRKEDDAWQLINMSPPVASGATWDIFNATFNASEIGNWSYRIFANDTGGNYNRSTITTLEVNWDYTWNLTPVDDVFASGFVGDNISIVNLTINNTGDKPLNFSFTDTATSPVSLYYNVSGPFYLNPGEVKYIEAYGYSNKEFIEQSFSFIFYSNSSTEPEKTLSANVVFMSGGPYMYVTESDTPLTVTQGDHPIYLSAGSKNIGNETAQDAWLAWDLPEGLYIPSPFVPANKSFPGSTSVGQIRWHNITVAVSSDAPIGEATYYIKTSSTGQTTSEKELQIVILSSDPVDDEETPVAGTVPSASPGAGGLPSEALQKIFQTEDIYDLVRGEGQFFRLTVENPIEYASLVNISLNVSGFMGQYLEVHPEQIDEIGINESDNFFIYAAAPQYLTIGKHDLELRLKAVIYRPGIFTYVDETHDVTLAIHTISREQAEELIRLLEMHISEMEEEDFRTGNLPRLLQQARTQLDDHEYDNVKATYEQGKSYRDAAFNSRERINELESKIEQAKFQGIQTPRTEKTLNLAKAAFLRGDYNSALERLEEAEYLFVVETKGERNILRFIIINWKQVLLGTILAAIALFGVYWKAKLAYMNHKIDTLWEDQKTIVGLMQETQKETFADKTMSMTEYRAAMEQYEQQLANAVQKSIALESAKVAHKNMFSRENRSEIERERLMELMKETQTAYLKENRIETRAYEHRMDTIRKRLTEVEEELAVQEAEKAIKEKGWLRSKLTRNTKSAIGRTRSEVKEKIKQKEEKQKQKKEKKNNKQELKRKKSEKKKHKKKIKEAKKKSKRRKEFERKE